MTIPDLSRGQMVKDLAEAGEALGDILDAVTLLEMNDMGEAAETLYSEMGNEAFRQVMAIAVTYAATFHRDYLEKVIDDVDEDK